MEIVANDDKDVTPQQAAAAAQFIAARYPNIPLYGHGQVNPGRKEATEGMTALNAAMALRAPGTAINAANAPVRGALAAQETGPESSNTGPAKAASEGPVDVRQLIYNKLIAAGLKPHQALGALYSLGGESSTFDTGAYNPNDPGGSIGIGQWNGVRRQRLEAAAKAAGVSYTDPNLQADFLVGSIADPNHPDYQPGVFKALQGAGNVADATNIWTGKFERPKVNNWQERFASGASRVGTLTDDNQFALGSGRASNTGPVVASAAGPRDATVAPVLPEPSLWDKFVNPGKDAQGKETASPMQQLSQAILQNPEQQRRAEQEQAPETKMPQGPGARNVSAGLAQAPTVWGQTINSMSTPLTWNNAPPQAPNLPRGGFQPAPGPMTTGVSINSIPANAYGLGVGYGIEPVGYGFGGYG
jgi:hypothetical protein